MTRYEIAKAEEIAAGKMKAFSVGGQRVLVVNLDGEFVAMGELCPHLSVPLSRGKLDGDCLTCIGHGSQFNLKDGSVVRWVGRKPGWISGLIDGKAKPLIRYPIHSESGTLFIEI